MAILFKLEGKNEAQAELRGVMGRMRDTSPALRFVGEETILTNTRRLRAGMDVDGKPMKKSRRAERSGGQTLFDRGQLVASQNTEVSKNVLEYFSTDPRARVHYEGGTIRPRPPKKF